MGNPNNRACSSPGTIPPLLTLHNITTPNKNTINITDYYVSGKGIVLKFPVRHSPSTPPSLGSVKKLEKDGKDDTEAETPSKIVTGKEILKTEEERQAEKTAAWEKNRDEWKYKQGRMWEKRRAAWLKKRAALVEKRDGIMGSDEEE